MASAARILHLLVAIVLLLPARAQAQSAGLICDAGPDQFRQCGNAIQLSGSSSAGTDAMYLWESDCDGDGIPNGPGDGVFSDPTDPAAVFIAPSNCVDCLLQLTVDDGGLAGPDCLPPPAGLISWWGGEGDAQDNWGLNHGTLFNGATTAPGLVGRAFDLSAPNSYVEIPHSDDLASPELTVEFWMKPEELPSGPTTPASKYDGAFNGWIVEYRTDGRAGFVLHRPAFNVQPSTTSVFPLGEWSHFAGTFDGTDIRVYFNGVLEDTLPMPAGYSPSRGVMRIGLASWFSGWHFPGQLDELEIYDRALADDEILALYEAGCAGKCGGGGECSGGGPCSDSVLISVADTTAPVIEASVARDCLWPPNHRLVDVGLSVDAVDDCDGDTTVILEAIVSDEATTSGGKPGACPDAVFDGAAVLLRSERDGAEDGRVYGIQLSSQDDCGNRAVSVVQVVVPHDQNPKTPGQTPGNDPVGPCPAVDTGRGVDATDCN